MKKHEHLAEDQSKNTVKSKSHENPTGPEPAAPGKLQDADSAEADPLARLELELAAGKDKYLRLLSEFDNYKKRVARERLDLVKMAGADVLLSVLPVLDDLERAIKAGQEAGTSGDGVVLIYNKLK